MLRELKDYAKALGKEDSEVYQELLKKPLKHFGSISYANSIHAWAFLILAILVEQEKKLKRLEGLYESLADGRLQEQEFGCAVDQDS